MRIQGTIKRHESMEISENQVKEIAIKFLKQKFDLPDRCKIVDGDLKEMFEVNTSHSWDEESIVRKATDIDKAVMFVLNEL